MSPSDRQRLITCTCAAFALALGVVTVFGWMTGNAVLVMVRPQWSPMVLNTAIGFILGGTALLAAATDHRLARNVASLLAVLLALLAVEELVVLLFDISPALSLPDLHRSLQPGYPRPGRMAPNTALCFLLFGAALWGYTRCAAGAISLWVQRAAVAVLAIGLLGIVGYSLQLEYLYGWSGVVRMAIHTGIGMVVLGIGLWNLARIDADRVWAAKGNEVTSVYRIATVLSVVIAMSAGIGGFALMQNQVEQQVRDALTTMTADRIGAFEQTIEDRSTRAEVVAESGTLALALRTLASQDGAGLAPLHTWAGRLVGRGFSSISVRTSGGHYQLMGQPVSQAFSVPMRGRNLGRLLWDDGYFLQRTLPVRDGAGIAGWLTTEQPMAALDQLIARTNHVGESGEMVVCGPGAGSSMACFPMRNRPLPGTIRRIVAGQRLPMSHALAGETGSKIAFYFMQHRVLAAYGTISDTGLGMVVKRDISEIYGPIRDRF
ncbi:MAG: diguanylate cyclase, partial [Xanthomonadaceae bacterium]|nr:diguanylate cyclase [Xanthomonadaceae bacterium]